MLAEVSDDVDWAAEAAGTAVPWFGPHHGKEGVARFFREIGANVAVAEFTLVGITSNDTDVIVTVHWSYTVSPTGKRPEMNLQHWWRFADGNIVYFRGLEVTLQSAQAFS